MKKENMKRGSALMDLINGTQNRLDNIVINGITVNYLYSSDLSEKARDIVKTIVVAEMQSTIAGYEKELAELE